MTLAVAILIAAILGALAWSMLNAPEGYEDSDGWHEGREG